MGLISRRISVAYQEVTYSNNYHIEGSHSLMYIYNNINFQQNF